MNDEVENINSSGNSAGRDYHFHLPSCQSCLSKMQILCYSGFPNCGWEFCTHYPAPGCVQTPQVTQSWGPSIDFPCTDKPCRIKKMMGRVRYERTAGISSCYNEKVTDAG